MAKNGHRGPNFVQYFGPLLNALREIGGSAKPEEAIDRVAHDLKIPDRVLDETLPSGAGRFRNRVAWARFYLTREGLLDSSKRGVWSLTEEGRQTTLSHEQAYSIFRKWAKVFQEERRRREEESAATENPTQATTPYSQTIVRKFSR